MKTKIEIWEEEETKARSAEDPTKVYTGPVEKEPLSSPGILPGCKPGAAGGHLCYLLASFWLRLELIQMKAELREHGSWGVSTSTSTGGGRHEPQVLHPALLRPPLKLSALQAITVPFF